MIARCSRKGFMTAAAVLLAVLLHAFAVERAGAACAVITGLNNTACSVQMSLFCPGVGVVGTITIAPGTAGSLAVPAGCVPVVRARVCGAPMAVPPGGCLFNVRVAPNCCADVCYNPAACTVTFTPTAGPCPC